MTWISHASHIVAKRLLSLDTTIAKRNINEVGCSVKLIDLFRNDLFTQIDFFQRPVNPSDNLYAPLKALMYCSNSWY